MSFYYKDHTELKKVALNDVHLILLPLQGKLVVGHNMLLDVMHTIHQFYCPLPEVKLTLSVGQQVWVWMLSGTWCGSSREGREVFVRVFKEGGK